MRTIAQDDPCPQCGRAVHFTKGIEVGHVFKLGTKYSHAMNATFLDENGKEKTMIMGCYGIGISRIVAAAIEQNNDEQGAVFPPSIAPFEVCLIALGAKDEAVSIVAEDVYQKLLQLGIDVLYDDRKERPGVKFADADLAGWPMQLVLGSKGLANGIIEAKNRKTGQRVDLELSDFIKVFSKWHQDVWNVWGLDL